MSFSATTTLALAFRQGPQQDRLRLSPSTWQHRLGRGCLALIRASFWASLATAPISLFHFGEVTWLGLVTNLVAVPLTTLIILPCALLGLATVEWLPSLGHGLLDVAIWLSQGIANVSYWLELQVPLVVRAPLNHVELLMWALVMFVFLQGRSLWGGALYQKRTMVYIGLGATLLFACSRGYWGRYQAQNRQNLRVTFVEIGQGDAAVLEIPGGEVWLIDGGGLPFVSAEAKGDADYIAESPARQALLPYLRHRRIEKIDLAIVSHPHPDHFIGLQAVSRVMPILELWSVHEPRKNPGRYEHWLEMLRKQGTLVRAPSVGLAKEKEGVTAYALWPKFTESHDADLVSAVDPILSVNDNSLVVRIEFAGRRFLFTGDIEAEAEELLVTEYPQGLRSDIVKVPHHGSATSSSTAFVEAVNASVAIISCGLANRFGFPDKEVEMRWQHGSDLVLRTDHVGSITIEVAPDGEMRVETVAPF